MKIAAAIHRTVAGESLERADMEAVFEEIVSGAASEVQKAALLVALAMKGETVAEIAAAAAVMRRHALAVTSVRGPLLDTCGTGGDGRSTINVSTAAALVAAGAGVAVAKHGNRSVSSRCGSADVLAALGVELELTAAQTGACLDRAGIAFLFAPLLHPAMKQVMGVRRELGVRTLFNIVGPLANPAAVTHQVLGVFHPRLVRPLAEVLRELSTVRALVLHSEDGLDEISLAAPTRCVELRDGTLNELRISAADFGLAPLEPDAQERELAGGDAAANAERIRAVLAGEKGARRDVVVANAAAAIWVAGIAANLREGAARAASAIDDGAAARALEALVACSRAERAA